MVSGLYFTPSKLVRTPPGVWVGGANSDREIRRGKKGKKNTWGCMTTRWLAVQCETLGTARQLLGNEERSFES